MFKEGKNYLVARDCEYSKYPSLGEYRVVKLVTAKGEDYVKFEDVSSEKPNTFWINLSKPEDKYSIIAEL